MYPYILLMFAVIFYAGNILVGKAINELPPFTITFFRLLTAFIVLLPIGVSGALRHREEFRKHKKPLLIMTVTGIALFNILLYGALQFTTSTKVAVMEGAIPVVTVIMSAYMLKERLNISQWSGILLSMAGAVWVVMNGNVLELATSDWNVGDVIMVGAVITWAIYTIAVKQYMPLFPLYGALLVMSGLSLIMLLPFLLIEWFVMGIPAFTVPTVGGFYIWAFFRLFLLLYFTIAL